MKTLKLIFTTIVKVIESFIVVVVPFVIGLSPFFLFFETGNRWFYLGVFITIPIAIWLGRFLNRLWFPADAEMELKFLTKKEAEEILHIIFPYPDRIKSEITHKYEDGKCGGDYYMMEFDAVMFGTEDVKIRIFIRGNLDCEMDYVSVYKKSEGRNFTIMTIKNQRAIQEKFTEFGF